MTLTVPAALPLRDREAAAGDRAPPRLPESSDSCLVAWPTLADLGGGGWRGAKDGKAVDLDDVLVVAKDHDLGALQGQAEADRIGAAADPAPFGEHDIDIRLRFTLVAVEWRAPCVQADRFGEHAGVVVAYGHVTAPRDGYVRP